MCFVRQRDLSVDDLSFLASRSMPVHEPDEDAINRSLAIHERADTCGPLCISQLVHSVPVNLNSPA
jgi:hypothetical protein